MSFAMIRRTAVIAVVSIVALLFAACNMPTAADLQALTAKAANARTLAAGPAVNLGTASTFAIIGGPAVTLTNAVVNGDVGTQGIYTNTSSVVHGTVYQIPTATPNAYRDFVNAYNALRASLDTNTATLLTSLPASLGPGVYYFKAAATVTGTLTLDAGGDPNAQWTFFIGSDGTGALTGTGFNVVMANGGVASNVNWWVAEAATMTDSNFQGTILAGAAITLTGGTFIGNALAEAAVTLTGTTLTGVLSSTGSGGGTNPPPKCLDFVTGGGWIDGNVDGNGHPRRWNRDLATFAISGGMRNGVPWGELSYNDHGKDGVKVKSTSITAYIVVDSKTRVIQGVARVNRNESVTFTVTVTDNGQPGRNDTFSIVLSNGYSASGNLKGGNIMLHKDCKADRGDKHDKLGNHDDNGNHYDKDEQDGIRNSDQ